jgi:activator of 2-hydroxyglutaryl-CoA dehydratase
MARWSALLTIACCVFLFAEAYAQTAPGSHLPQNMAGILDALPSNVLAKVQRLAQMLQQNINEGKITDAQIQRELMSGNLQQTIKSINPEAGDLLDDINASMKNSPNAENLPDLLGGLTGQKP